MKKGEHFNRLWRDKSVCWRDIYWSMLTVLNAPLNMIVSKKRRSTEQEQHHPALTLLLVVVTISFITINIPTILVLGSFFPGWRQKPIRVRQHD